MAAQKKIADLIDFMAELFTGFIPSDSKAMAWDAVLGHIPRPELFEAATIAIKTSSNPQFPPSAPAILACVGGKRHMIPVHATDQWDRVIIRGDGPVVVRRIEVRLAPGVTIPEFYTEGDARRMEARMAREAPTLGPAEARLEIPGPDAP